MRIAFPTRDRETIVRHFGRMEAFVVVDVVDGERTRDVRDMSDLPECGGDGARPAHVVEALGDCDVLVANRIGIPLVERLRRAGLEVVLTAVRSIDEALDAYLAGTLAHEPELAHTPHH